MSAVKDFKKFANKGNIFDLAVGVIMGSAFTAIVNSLVNDIITPLVSSAINFDLTTMKVVLKPAVMDGDEVIKAAITLNYGNFLQAFMRFLIIALGIFVAIKTVQALKNSYVKQEIKFLQRLQKKHPEYFDEETDFGTKEYERLKREHPELFKNEEAEEIEELREEAQAAKSPDEVQIDLFREINENLQRLNGSQVNQINSQDEISDEEE